MNTNKRLLKQLFDILLTFWFLVEFGVQIIVQEDIRRTFFFTGVCRQVNAANNKRSEFN